MPTLEPGKHVFHPQDLVGATQMSDVAGATPDGRVVRPSPAACRVLEAAVAGRDNRLPSATYKRWSTPVRPLLHWTWPLRPTGRTHSLAMVCAAGD